MQVIPISSLNEISNGNFSNVLLLIQRQDKTTFLWFPVFLIILLIHFWKLCVSFALYLEVESFVVVFKYCSFFVKSSIWMLIFRDQLYFFRAAKVKSVTSSRNYWEEESKCFFFLLCHLHASRFHIKRICEHREEKTQNRTETEWTAEVEIAWKLRKMPWRT